MLLDRLSEEAAPLIERLKNDLQSHKELDSRLDLLITTKLSEFKSEFSAETLDVCLEALAEVRKDRQKKLREIAAISADIERGTISQMAQRRLTRNAHTF